MRDVLPDEVEVRDRAQATILDVYRRHGFQRIETPAVESAKLEPVKSEPKTEPAKAMALDHESQAKPIYAVRERIGFGHRVGAGETSGIKQSDKTPAEVKLVAPDSETRRPFGLCAGEFVTPDDFDEPLPDSVLQEFEK